MLNSLSIKNYRNLKDFKIDSIERINLITGKNNTGKSTLLEAVALYASRGLNPYLPAHQSKARVHSWLAWQEDPGTPLGLSITKKYLTTETAACQNLVDWLKRLFEE